MDAGKVPLTSAQCKTWADVIPHYEVLSTDGSLLRFACARCRLVFAWPAKGASRAGVLHLKAHLARHGIFFAETAPAKRARKPGARGLDAAGRPTQARFAFDAGPPSESE